MLFADLFVQIYEWLSRLDGNDRKDVLLFDVILPDFLSWLELSFEHMQIAYPLLNLVHYAARIYLKSLTLFDCLHLILLLFLFFTPKSVSYLSYR